MGPPEIYARRLRRLRRDRAAADWRAHDVVRRHLVDELLDRLDSVTRRFTRALDLGTADGILADALRARGVSVVSADAGLRFARRTGGIQCDEDRPPFADGSFDLVVSAGVLDQVNDLPGALALIRRMLRPDGLFLGGMIGAGSLPRLRAAVRAADGAEAVARLHPQIDLRAAGDLLQRAGFALPVADGLPLDVTYRDPARLLADLRGQALANQLVGQGPPAFGRDRRRRLLAALTPPDGERLVERFALILLTGWSPSADQPRPARRGSATVSLADALRPHAPEG